MKISRFQIPVASLLLAVFCGCTVVNVPPAPKPPPQALPIPSATPPAMTTTFAAADPTTAPMPQADAQGGGQTVGQPLTNRAIALAWDVPASWPAGYTLFSSSNNVDWFATPGIPPTNQINVTNFTTPMEFKLVAVDSNGFQSPPSNLAAYRVASNGSVLNQAFYFMAQSNLTYVLSNAPLTANRWKYLTTVSNATGLTKIPLPGVSGQVKWLAEGL